MSASRRDSPAGPPEPAAPPPRSFRGVRGIPDVLPDEMPAWERLERTARELATLRGYREIRPALVEEADLFIRTVGEVTDIVEKEMFVIEKGEHRFALRPEGTAGIARAYLQAGWAKTAPVQRLFHVGPMFRYERPQKGRERMFTQFDVEALGSTDPRFDVEVIEIAARFFEELGIEGVEIHLNSMGDGADRDRYRDAIRAFLEPRLGELCELCNARFQRNVLRVLDCKNPACREIFAEASDVVMLEFLSDENREHLDTVRDLLEAIDRTVRLDGQLVRGLDYYTRTVFEVHYPALGARSALCGGGRYDHLLRDLGGPDLGAVGFAVGFTPTLVALRELGHLGRVRSPVADVYVVGAAAGLEREVLLVAEELRRGGLSAVYDTEGKSLKAQMKAAAKGGHALAAIIGPDELEAEAVQLKDLARGEQSAVPRSTLVAATRDLLAGR